MHNVHMQLSWKKILLFRLEVFLCLKFQERSKESSYQFSLSIGLRTNVAKKAIEIQKFLYPRQPFRVKVVLIYCP